MDESNKTELKRRDVLKRGAVATGALVVGGTAMSGSVGATQGGAKGGAGFSFEEPPTVDGSRVTKFRINELKTDVEDFQFATGCGQSDDLQTYNEFYEIQYVTVDETGACTDVEAARLYPHPNDKRLVELPSDQIFEVKTWCEAQATRSGVDETAFELNVSPTRESCT